MARRSKDSLEEEEKKKMKTTTWIHKQRRLSKDDKPDGGQCRGCLGSVSSRSIEPDLRVKQANS